MERTASLWWVVGAALYVLAKAALSGCFAVAVMLWKQVTSPRRRLFSHTRRLSPPKCLQDPALGQHGFVTVKGLKFHYVEKGDRSKPLMLFVHGFLNFWYSWRHQMKEFSEDYWTVAVDMRGYGDSAKPTNVTDYEIFLLVEDIKGIVTELGREKFILVAHDWGAVISWTFIETYPEMIERYILMNGPSSNVFSELSASFSSNQSSKSGYRYRSLIPYLAELAVSFDDFRMLGDLQLAPKTSNPYLTDDDIEAYKYKFSQPGALLPPMNYYRAGFLKMVLQGLYPKDLEDKKGNGTRPTGLFIFGAHDFALDIKCVELHKARIENLETLIIEEGNHFINQDEPVVVNKAMRSFLQSCYVSF